MRPRAGGSEPRREPQQPAHGERGQRRCAAAAGGGGIDREAEGRGAAPDQGERVAPCPERDRGGDAAGAEEVTEQRRRARPRPQSPSASRTAASSCLSRAKKAGDSALISTCAGRPSASQHQRMRGRRGIGSGERAVLEQQPHDRLAAARSIRASPAAPAPPRVRAHAIAHAQRHRDRRCRRRASVPAPARCPWRRRRCRAATRSGGWRNRATTPPKASSRR